MVPRKKFSDQNKTHVMCNHCAFEGYANGVSSPYWSVWISSFREFPGICGFGLMKWPSRVMKCLQVGSSAQRAPRSPQFNSELYRYSLLLKLVGCSPDRLTLGTIAAHWSRWLNWLNIWLCTRDWLISFSNRWGTWSHPTEHGEGSNNSIDIHREF